MLNSTQGDVQSVAQIDQPAATASNENSAFGASSIISLGDINGDVMIDIAIGAPAYNNR